jgi:hypothetical protein
MFDLYISSSWKQRERVRNLAIQLRNVGLTVYDFTDPACRDTPEVPPEKYPEQFDPEKHIYREYLESQPEWKMAVECNRRALNNSSMVVLLLPCGLDSHADWAYAVGKGKYTAVVGSPKAGERTPSHMWCDEMLDSDDDIEGWCLAVKRFGDKERLGK